METQTTLTAQEFIEIVKRRRWSLILPALAVFFIAVVICLVMDPVYLSTSTILIEDQDISRNFVAATGASVVEQRLQTINQRIMSSARLLEIINRFNLYADERKRQTTEQLIEDMREKYVKFETITSEVVNPQTGRPNTATIAFTVSFEGENPTVVQQVANVLTSLYLEENIKVKQQQTSSATKFLEDEVKSVQTKLEEFEKKIAVYKEKHTVALPELFEFNLQAMERVERDIGQMKDQLRALQERESAFQNQLASIPPEADSTDKARLKELQLKLVNLKARVSDEYPDVIKTKEEIAEIARRLDSAGSKSSAKPPDNPLYITLNSQLASTKSEIDSLKRQISDLNKRKSEFSRRLENSPRVDEGYKNLMVERNNTQAKYDDLMKKFMEAKVASGLEKGQMGERFTLINPPQLPEKPSKPNYLAILLIGFILGIGSGVGTASFREHSDQSVMNAEALAKATGFTVLASIPDIIISQDITAMKKKRIIIIVSIVLIIIISVILFHFFIMDLDVFWARLTRRFAI